jgi:Selenocysteine lyase
MEITQFPSTEESFGYPLKKHFHIDPEIINLNSGEYGMTPKCIIDAKIRYYATMEKNTDLFIRYHQTDMIEETRKVVAEYLQADPEGIVFLGDSAEAIHTYLKSICETKGKGILYHDFLSPETKNICHYISEYFGIDTLEIPTSKDLINSSEKILLNLEEYLNEEKIKIVIIEHISRMGFLMPVKEIVQICRKNNILCLVDGSQAFGQIDIHINELNPGKGAFTNVYLDRFLCNELS